MLPDSPVPLADGEAGCALGEQMRKVQNGSDVFYISLNQAFLQQLGIYQQGALTKHSVALRPVEIQNPAYVIQPAEVLDE